MVDRMQMRMIEWRRTRFLSVRLARPAPSVDLAGFICRTYFGVPVLEHVLLPINILFGSKSCSVAFSIQQAISTVGELSWLDFLSLFPKLIFGLILSVF